MGKAGSPPVFRVAQSLLDTTRANGFAAGKEIVYEQLDLA